MDYVFFCNINQKLSTLIHRDTEHDKQRVLFTDDEKTSTAFS